MRISNLSKAVYSLNVRQVKKTVALFISGLFILSIISFFPPSGVQAATPVLPFTDNFANLNTWTIVDGTWTQITSGVQASSSSEALIYSGSKTWTNYQITTQVTIPAAGEASIVFRLADSYNYYWAGIGCWKHQYSISKVIGGTYSEITSSGTSASNTAGTYTLKVIAQGSTITLYVNDVSVLTTTDTALSSGAIGLRTYGTTMQARSLSASTPTPVLPFTDNFANLNTWTIVDGTWTQITSGVQASSSSEALIYSGSKTWTNYQITTQVTIPAAGEASIVFRLADSYNYYWAGIGCWKHQYSISKVIGGTYSEITSSGTSASNTAGTYTLKVIAQGSTITLYVNDVSVLTTTDTALSSGAIGLRTYGTTMQARSLSASTPTPSPTPPSSPTATPQPSPTSTPSPTPSPSPTATPNPQTATYSYIISISGSNYIMKNGITGQTEYQSTNPVQVFTNAFSRLNQGGSVLTKAGTYNLPQTITATGVNNIKWYFEEGATLFVSNGMNAPAISLLQSSNWLIQNPTINGNMANQISAAGSQGLGKSLFGILINGGSNNLVDSATITNCGQYGVFVSNTLSGNPAVNNGVTNSLITYCGWNGITAGVYGQPTKDSDDYFTNNEIHHCGDVGISTYALRSRIENNYIHDLQGTKGWDNASVGIAVEGGNSNNIKRNIIDNCRLGIITNTAPFDSNTITLNTINRCINGIALRSSYNTVTNNIITDYNYAGDGNGKAISLLNANYNKINDNQIRSTLSGANAIHLGTSANNEILRNTIVADPSKTNWWSIELYSSPRTDIEQNIISGFNGIGIVNAASINTIIRYNDLTSCTGVRIRDLGTGTIKLGNLPP